MSDDATTNEINDLLKSAAKANVVRNDRRRSCEGKHLHIEQAAAEAEAKRMTEASGEVMEAYACRHGHDGWHVGHALPCGDRAEVQFLIVVESGFSALAGFTGSTVAKQAACAGTRIKGLPTEYGWWIFDGALITSSRGTKTIVGQSRPLCIGDSEIKWLTI